MVRRLFPDSPTQRQSNRENTFSLLLARRKDEVAQLTETIFALNDRLEEQAAVVTEEKNRLKNMGPGERRLDQMDRLWEELMEKERQLYNLDLLWDQLEEREKQLEELEEGDRRLKQREKLEERDRRLKRRERLE